MSHEHHISQEWDRELASARARKISGEITLTVGLNDGGITRSTIKIDRTLRAPTRPRGPIAGNPAAAGFETDTPNP